MSEAYKVTFEKTVQGHRLSGVGEIRSEMTAVDAADRSVVFCRVSLDLMIAVTNDKTGFLTSATDPLAK